MGINILPVDLKKRRAEHRMTQEDLAAMLDVTRVQVARIETGERNITLRNVLKCVDRFGGLKVRMGDSVYVIQKQESFGGDDDPRNGKPHDDIPNDEELNDLDAAEHISNVRSQAADVIEVANRLERRWLAIRNGCPSGENDFADYYAEAYELKWAVDGVIEDGETDRPELVKRGRHIALQRRPGYLKEGDDVEPAA